jgi:hypothetical protein
MVEFLYLDAQHLPQQTGFSGLCHEVEPLASENDEELVS